MKLATQKSDDFALEVGKRRVQLARNDIIGIELFERLACLRVGRRGEPRRRAGEQGASMQCDPHPADPPSLLTRIATKASCEMTTV